MDTIQTRNELCPRSVNKRKVKIGENIFVIFDFENQTAPAKQRTEEAAELSSNFKREDLLLYGDGNRQIKDLLLEKVLFIPW